MNKNGIFNKKQDYWNNKNKAFVDQNELSVQIVIMFQ